MSTARPRPAREDAETPIVPPPSRARGFSSRRAQPRSAVKAGLTETERAWLRGQLVDAPEGSPVETPPEPTPRAGKKERPAAASTGPSEDDSGKYRMVVACSCRTKTIPGDEA
jgi:hypothetical protein